MNDIYCKKERTGIDINTKIKQFIIALTLIWNNFLNELIQVQLWVVIPRQAEC